ncbi:DMT family transporter [Cohnella faecalis]|uniref:LuxR family transcriptional regulator n=1 Tax=Cohnella faecalis TaxID=2315694 RepID=A0A398CRG9_9BACL|nr:DMT family transporter [Cohnella faecalis]RIE03378.1 LuxR family transcriptional regulator [Cohnella faecalis]
MAILAILLVILSGFIHSIWNLFAKKSINKIVFLWYCQWAAVLLFLPLAWIDARTIESLPANGWLLMAASMILHGAYVLLLAKAYTIGDLSQVYPIMRGISPLVVPVIGVLILGENLKMLGWSGIVVILVGIFLGGSFKFKDHREFLSGPIILAFLVGIMITSYTVVDKVTLQYVPAITLNEATNVGNLLILTFMALKSKGLKREWLVNWKTIMLGGILAPGGYILFLKALEILPVSQLAPMREIGTVFGTLMGVFMLRESQGRSRIIASILITIGIVLLAQ